MYRPSAKCVRATILFVGTFQVVSVLEAKQLFTRTLACAGVHWISLPTETSILTAKDICALVGPSALTVTEIFPDGIGASTFDCYNSVGTGFSVVDGEGFEVETNAPAVFPIDGCDAAIPITLPPGGMEYLVSVPYCPTVSTYDQLGSLIEPPVGVQRATVTGRDTCLGTFTTASVGTAAAQAALLVEGEAYRIRRTNTNGASYINPASTIDSDGDGVPDCCDDCPTIPGPCPLVCVAPPGGMVDWWTFDETTGTTANDSALFNNVGGELNGVAHSPGYVAEGLSFDGVNDYVDVADHSELDFGMGDLTIDAWVKTTVANGILPIVDKRDATPQGYTLFLSSGRLAFQMGDASGSDCICSTNATSACTNFGAPTSSVNVADGNWHHVAVTVRRSSHSGGTLYVDGGVVLNFDPTVRAGSLDNTADLWIGQTHLNACGATSYWRGDIDEIEMFNRALGITEINTIVMAGAQGQCKWNPLNCDDGNPCTIDRCNLEQAQ